MGTWARRWPVGRPHRRAATESSWWTGCKQTAESLSSSGWPGSRECWSLPAPGRSIGLESRGRFLSRGQFLKQIFCAYRKVGAYAALLSRAPPLRRRKLAPRREVGTYASFKKLASDALKFQQQDPIQRHLDQGCQMVCFQTKNANLDKFWRVLQWNMLVYFMETWSILWSSVIFYWHLAKFVEIWCILSRFGILNQETSGNPDLDPILRSWVHRQCCKKLHTAAKAT
jgi:hypothetical protein